jgi:hypothetical protein
MLVFYGLEDTRTASALHIVRSERFPERARVWLSPGNHNHLRLTRMMESLSALGLREEARALRRCLLTDVYGGPGRGLVTPETYTYWLAGADD